MYQYQSIDDTIAAIATPAGQGGIGIVRISGAQALAIADAVFRCAHTGKPSEVKSFKVRYGWVVVGTDTMDEALLTVMRGPKSYTAQDVVEINCHGGLAVTRAVLELVLRQGARLAEPGEFTKRAFLNGRIDLTQAEAVLDVIQAKTAAFARVGLNQLKGDLAVELVSIRAELMSVYISIEAVINFPEDDISAQGRAEILGRVRAQVARMTALLASSRNGRILKDGIRVVLCGKPNTGKSSILNVLLKSNRAIVTPIAGTTRDVLEETAQIQGVPLLLVDTAGILEPRDLVEQEALKRSHAAMDAADLILFILDSSQTLDDTDRDLLRKLDGRPVLLVLNKCDLPLKLDVPSLPGTKHVLISARSKIAIADLETAILQLVWQGENLNPHKIFVSNLRHIKALETACQCLSELDAAHAAHTPWEIISQNIKDAVNNLDAITGRDIDEDLLDRIFSEFCIGK